MLLISTHNHELQKRVHLEPCEVGFFTAIDQLDRLMPANGLQSGAIHEVLHDAENSALFFALLLARAGSIKKARSFAPIQRVNFIRPQQRRCCR